MICTCYSPLFCSISCSGCYLFDLGTVWDIFMEVGQVDLEEFMFFNIPSWCGIYSYRHEKYCPRGSFFPLGQQVQEDIGGVETHHELHVYHSPFSALHFQLQRVLFWCSIEQGKPHRMKKRLPSFFHSTLAYSCQVPIFLPKPTSRFFVSHLSPRDHR